MQISRKADYALRAMVILAGASPDRSLQAQELAETGAIPAKFLEQILLLLKRADILQSKRGVGGGYRLNREARNISLADVVETVDGELVRLADAERYPQFSGAEGLDSSLKQAEEAVNSRLRAISIEDVIKFGSGEVMAGAGI
ncbi:MAG: Rrf2 family transcriptional regulator [Verrucomicrobiota bacterium]